MVRASLFAAALVSMLATLSGAQTGDFKPVTREMLANPDPGDWLMLNRTYDEQRFSPLKQINRDTVAGLTLAWARGMAARSSIRASCMSSARALACSRSMPRTAI
jgi:glucose dehydrogenase